MRTRTLVAAIALAFSACFGAVIRADAAPLGCGAVITTDTTLTADVGPCAENGLIVSANNVTLNLGGHTVFGVSRHGHEIGIKLDHVSNVRVADGTVTSFAAGVVVAGGSSNTVSAISAVANVGAAASNYGDGIVIQQSNSNTVTHSVAIGNGPYDGITVLNDALHPSIGSDGNVIEGNTVVDNRVVATGTAFQQDDGIRIEGPNATNTTIKGNHVSGSGLDGVAVFADQGTGFPNTGTHIDSNVITGGGFHPYGYRKGDGIILFGAPTVPAIHGADDSVVHGNTVTGNAGNGIAVASAHNTISRNVATGNAAVTTFPAWDLFDDNTTPPCDSNVWANDTFGTRNQTCIS